MKIPFTNRVLTINREKRQYTLDDDSLYNRVYRGREAKSGATVNTITAMQSSAVWACIRVLSSQLASYPLVVYKRLEKGKERAPQAPLYRLLHNEPNPIQTSYVFRSTAMTHLCLYGDSYAEIQYKGNEPVALWQIPPWKVKVDISPNKIGLRYEISLPDGTTKKLADWQVLHFKGLSTNGFTGLAPIIHAREAIGLSLAAEEFGATYFGEGTNVAGVIEHPAELSDEAYKRLSQSLKEKYAGLGKAHRLMLLEEGMKFDKLTIPPDQSQFLETRQFQVLEICRIFGVPPHMVADLDRATFSNIEEQAISFVTHTMQPWIVNFEQELNRKLFSDSPYFVEFLLEGALRGKTIERYQSYQIARNWGWMSANDVRDLENMNPLPDEQGDMYLVPMNMQPADWLTEPPMLPDMGKQVPQSSTIEERSETRNLTKNRFLVARSYRRVFEEAGRRVVEREVSNVRKALKKHLGERNVTLFRDWLEDFYRDFPDFIQKQMLAASQSLAEAIEPLVKEQLKRESTADIRSFINEYLTAYAVRHTSSSQGQIEALLEEDEFEDLIETRLQEWEEKRPSKIGMNETVQLSNAICLTLAAGAGVISLIWRNTSGDSCPYCEELDGKKVGVNQDFVGETVFAEGEKNMNIRRPAMQPPLHRGCQCQIEPE